MTATININRTERGCLGKVRYYNRVNAKAAATGMRRRGLTKPGKVLCAYHCELCCCWHVGNRRSL